MRIDNLTASAITAVETEVAAAAKPAADTQSQRKSALPEDTASLSSQSSPVPSLTSQALASAEARAAKVEALRLAVASAQYTIDPALIADAMISVGE